MMHQVLFVLAATILVTAQACVFGACKWDTLKITWSPNVFGHWAFNTMPRNVHSNAMGFTMKDNYCNSDGTPRGAFAGMRYWKNSDPAVILLFDVNGIIAGIQSAVPQSQWPGGPPPNQQGHPYTLADGYWVLTAYFVPVAQICRGGRTAAQLQSQGTGTGLWIQNGTDSSQLMMIAKQEADIRQTPWTLGHCFYTMGNHYWYNVTSNMPCRNFFPACMLYNQGKLNAFCWGINTQLTSPRYEHPTYAVLNRFIKPVPTCFRTDPTYAHFSTMHIYFSSELTDLC